MKRIASILLTAVLVITICGIGVFADDAKADAQSSDAYDITKWNFHLDKTTFEYGVMKDKAKKYYGKHDEIAKEKGRSGS